MVTILWGPFRDLHDLISALRDLHAEPAVRL